MSQRQQATWKSETEHICKRLQDQALFLYSLLSMTKANLKNRLSRDGTKDNARKIYFITALRVS